MSIGGGTRVMTPARAYPPKQKGVAYRVVAQQEKISSKVG